MGRASRILVALGLVVVLAGCSYIGAKSSTVPETPDASPTTATPTASASAAEGFVSDAEAADLLRRCGISGRVAAYFRIPSGNDYHDHFPLMGISPEIEGISGLFVAVYDGPIEGLFSGRPGASRGPVTDALCVVTPGEPIIYANVSREGMLLPPGAWLNPDPRPTSSPDPSATATASPVSGGPIGVVEAVALARGHVSQPDLATIWGWEQGEFGYLFARFAQSWGEPDQPRPDVARAGTLTWVVIFQLPVEVCDRGGSGCKTRTGLESVFLSSEDGKWLYTSTYGPPVVALPTPQQGSEPIVDPLRLSIYNGTDLTLSLSVNGQTVGEFGPAAYSDPIDSMLLPAGPWHVEAVTSSGRVLASLDVRSGDLWHTPEGPGAPSSVVGKATRVDLSCGRLDMWAGPPLAGPPPPDTFPPGDCDT